ncbi:hypothetical protein WJX81_006255 [Elliptochloris bilobata]|uniref:Profilin n=1 Tax=Elliptochloris bilobata TaxID=381761 RepID=A0AAW1QHT6_9CHLO
MSWQSYVDEHLMCELPHGGQLASAAIVGQDGGVWAQSDGFPEILPEQVEKIVGALKSETANSNLAQHGLHLGSTKYITIPGEQGVVIRGKKGAEGVTIKATATALVIGIYSEGVQPGDVNIVVENLGDYLKEQGM